MDIKALKIKIIDAGQKAVDELINVAKEKIVTGTEDDVSADRLKNAAATKKLAIFDAFEILKRIEEERDRLEGKDIKKNNLPKGFAEKKIKIAYTVFYKKLCLIKLCLLKTDIDLGSMVIMISMIL